MIQQNGVTKVQHLLVSLKTCCNWHVLLHSVHYNRNESRGAHYKPEFPERNDEEFLKTTMAKFDG